MQERLTETACIERTTAPRGPAALAAVAAFAAAVLPAGAQNVDFAAAEIEIVPVQGNVYMLVGPIGNSTVQVGDDGVLIVDTQFAELSGKILAAIRELSDGPIRYVVNTHAHPDHTGGNEPIARAGATIAGGNVSGTITDAGEGAAIVAHENALFTMTQQEPTPPFDALPTQTFFTDRKDLYFNGEAVLLVHQPDAHTSGDSLVHFRASDVIATGDIFVTTTYPFIDEANGGHIEGIIAGLNRVIEIAVPADKQEGGTLIVPGHGRLCDEADVVEYRDMLTIIRDRIGDMVEHGMSLRQVQAARPTRDYDGRYGADSGFWTTEQFVAAVYRNLDRGAIAAARRATAR
jgi:glyoxylase-like metal-dependent hydrolase (beta-lactamase superfamily II)